MTFRVLRAGESFHDVDITKDGLVVWDIYNTGFVHPTYGDYINIISPASLTSFARLWTNTAINWKIVKTLMVVPVQR